MSEDQEIEGDVIGKIAHYFSNIGVAVIELSGTLKVGDTIHVKGATSDVRQEVESMQIEHDKVEKAKKGQSVGLKVEDHVRENDVVYKV
jgi:translation initiation factor IF-2